jgi:hypothetical protein
MRDRDHLGNSGIDRRIIMVKWIFRKWAVGY